LCIFHGFLAQGDVRFGSEKIAPRNAAGIAPANFRVACDGKGFWDPGSQMVALKGKKT
jgi:hypothetical protein